MPTASAPEIIVQITDAHIGDDGAEQALRRAVDAIGLLDPAPLAVLLTGDIAEHGAVEEYALARELLAPLAVPLHPLPGNHDDRAALRAAFADHPGVAATDEFIHYAVDCGSVRVLMCDTTEPGEDGGRLCERRLEWIAAGLADGAALLALHHPPISVAMPAFDAIGVRAGDRARLAELVSDAPSLERIAAGHVHRTIAGDLGGRPVFVCPSVFLQGLLDLRPEGRLALVDEPPGYALHVRAGGEPLVTHVVPLAR